MTQRQFRYDPKTKLPAQRPPTLDLVASDVKEVVGPPMTITDVIDEAVGKATAEEALAVAIDLWKNLQALEDADRKAKQKRKSGVDQLLITGQIMGIKSAITQHLARHAANTRRRLKPDSGS